MPVDPTDPDLPLPGASPLTAYTRFWRRYVVFSGRASLSEYWWVALVNGIVAIVIGVIGVILLAIGGALGQQGSAAAAVPNALGAVLLFLLAVLVVALIVPGLAVSVRRLHDANLSGLLYLLTFIPSVGGLIVLVLHVLPSNPEGRRYDRGAPRWQQVAPALPSTSAARPASSLPSAAANGGFDAWPAPAVVAPATAPMPVARPFDTAPTLDTAQAPDGALVAAWAAVGDVERVEPKLGVQPSWRRQGYLLIRRPDGLPVLSTNGLAEAEGAAALGPGAEVYLAAEDSGRTAAEIAESWRFTVIAAVARRIGASGMHLPAELEQYGALSMSVSVDAPAEWRSADGGVGVLVGIGLPGIPEAVATSAGEVRLVGLTVLRPEELQRILVGGRDERAAIAAALAALPPAQLTSPTRPAV